MIAILALLSTAQPVTPPPPAQAQPGSEARARANLASYVSEDDYPVDALRAREEGSVSFRLVVGRDGRPTYCVVSMTSGSESLDATTCRIMMERARFTPARDAAGHNVTDVASGRIRWQLQGDPEPIVVVDVRDLVLSFGEFVREDDYPAEAAAERAFGMVEFSIDVGSDNRPSNCRVTRSSGSAALDRRACEIAMTRPRYVAGTDAPGRPVNDRLRGRIFWRPRVPVSLSFLPPPRAPAAAPAPLAVPTPPPASTPPTRGDGRAARARASLSSYVTDDDYPLEALRGHEQGMAAFRLGVGIDGSVTSCVITSSTDSPSLDETTCRLMTERAHFTPALDRRGRPTTDTATGRINWRIQEAEPVGPQEPVRAGWINLRPYLGAADFAAEVRDLGVDGVVDFRLTFSPTGTVTACRVVNSSGNHTLDERTCTLMTERVRIEPALNADGVADTAFVNATIHWRLP